MQRPRRSIDDDLARHAEAGVERVRAFDRIGASGWCGEVDVGTARAGELDLAVGDRRAVGGGDSGGGEEGLRLEAMAAGAGQVQHILLTVLQVDRRRGELEVAERDIDALRGRCWRGGD